MEIDVRVTIVPDEDNRSTEGVVRTDVPIEQVQAEIVEALGLGSADAWNIAMVPANPEVTLSQYTPTDGDTLLLVKKSVSQAKAFRTK